VTAEKQERPAYSKDPPWWDGIWREHLSLLAGVGTALLVAFRILAMANFDPETAYAILQTAGTGTIIIGVFLSSAGFIAYIAVFLCIARYRMLKVSETHAGEQGNFLVAAGTLFGVVAFLTTPAILFVGLVILFLATLWPPKFLTTRKTAETDDNSDSAEKGKRRSRLKAFLAAPQQLNTRITLIASMTILVVILVVTSPSLPIEELTLKGSHPLAAYVLSSQGSSYVVLLPNSSKIEFLHKVTDVKLCDPGNDALLSPLPRLLFALRPHYPLCHGY
jgi:hypothetical protein